MAGSSGWAQMSGTEQEVFAEINVARTQPKIFAGFIEEESKLIKNNKLYRKGEEVPTVLKEGMQAYKEAISALSAQPPLPALQTTPLGMVKAAKDHARDLAPGKTGHTGSDGSTPGDRMNRHGSWEGKYCENISFGSSKPRDIVISLLVDDGVAGRGHRKNMLTPELRVCGVAFGKHATYGCCCVQTYAAGYTEKGAPSGRARAAPHALATRNEPVPHGSSALSDALKVQKQRRKAKEVENNGVAAGHQFAHRPLPAERPQQDKRLAPYYNNTPLQQPRHTYTHMPQGRGYERAPGVPWYTTAQPHRPPEARQSPIRRVPSVPPTSLQQGKRIRVRGLTNDTTFNGRTGTVVQPVHELGAWRVFLDGENSTRLMLPQNIENISGEGAPPQRHEAQHQQPSRFDLPDSELVNKKVTEILNTTKLKLNRDEQEAPHVSPARQEEEPVTPQVIAPNNTFNSPVVLEPEGEPFPFSQPQDSLAQKLEDAQTELHEAAAREARLKQELEALKGAQANKLYPAFDVLQPHPTPVSPKPLEHDAQHSFSNLMEPSQQPFSEPQAEPQVSPIPHSNTFVSSLPPSALLQVPSYVVPQADSQPQIPSEPIAYRDSVPRAIAPSVDLVSVSHPGPGQQSAPAVAPSTSQPIYQPPNPHTTPQQDPASQLRSESIPEAVPQHLISRRDTLPSPAVDTVQPNLPLSGMGTMKPLSQPLRPLSPVPAAITKVPPADNISGVEKPINEYVSLVIPHISQKVVLSCGGLYQDLAGAYVLQEDRVNGRPLWMQVEGPGYLFCSQAGVWTVTDERGNMGLGAGYIAAKVTVDAGKMPSALWRGEWRQLGEDGQWEECRDVFVSSVPAAYVRNVAANARARVQAVFGERAIPVSDSNDVVSSRTAGGLSVTVVLEPAQTRPLVHGYVSDAPIVSSYASMEPVAHKASSKHHPRVAETFPQWDDIGRHRSVQERKIEELRKQEAEQHVSEAAKWRHLNDPQTS